jgi:TetR/AcrR family transcriptional repressor of uid operon
MGETLAKRRPGAENRREQILDAAAECFSKHGFHAATMQEISKTAGMSVGHIYHYFENKDAIISAIVEQEFDDVVELFDELAKERDILSAMVARADYGFQERTEGKNAALYLEIVAQAARNPALAAQLEATDQRVRRKIRGLVAKGREAAGVPPISERQLDAEFEVIAALFDGLSIRAIRNPNLERDLMLDAVRRAMRALLHI